MHSIVGDEIALGRYRITGYWARLDSALEIIDNDIINDGLSLLTVFEDDSCIEINGEAMQVEDFNGGVADPFLVGWTDGTCIVGMDVQPARDRVTDPSYAYAARLMCDREIIDNEGNVIVSASDCLFEYSGELEYLD